MWNSLTITFKIYFLILLASSIYGLARYKKLNIPLRFVVILIVFTTLTEALSRVLAFSIRNSNPAYHLYSFGECLILGFLFYSITANKLLRHVIMAVFVSLTVFSIINSLFIQSISTFNSNIDLVKMPVTVAVATVLIFQKLNTEPVPGEKLLTMDLIILIGLLWFNTCSFAFNATHNILLDQNISASWIGKIHYYVNLVYYLIYLTALVFSGKIQMSNDLRYT